MWSCSAVKLLDEISHTLRSLRSCLSGTAAGSSAGEETSGCAEDVGQCVKDSDGQMCVDESEYERQMLEVQARQEQMDEECILAFQVPCASLCHVSRVTSDGSTDVKLL